MPQTLTEVEALVADRDEWKRKAEERGRWLDHATNTITGVWSALGIAHAGGPGLVERVKELVARLPSTKSSLETREPMPKPTAEQLRNRFIHHPPDEDRRKKHELVTSLTLQLAIELTDLCPEGRQLSLALTDLESVRMRANAAIAGAE